MKKKKICFFIFLIFTFIFTFFSFSFLNNFIQTDSNSDHKGYHYLRIDPSLTKHGVNEFWACCSCHQQFLEKPSGTFTERDTAEVYSEIDSNHVAYLPPINTPYSLFDGLVTISQTPGIYNGEFYLSILENKSGFSIKYNLECQAPSVNDPNFNEPILIKNDQSFPSDLYKLTKSVNGNIDSYQTKLEEYYEKIQKPGIYPKISHSNVVTLGLYNGDTLINKTILNYLVSTNEMITNKPIFFLNMPYENWFDENDTNTGYGVGLYNCINEDNSYRCDVFYSDVENKNQFVINSQIKLGGAMTIGYPQRTLNFNFKKNEAGEKQKALKVDLFHGKNTAIDGSNIKSYKRFRLWNRGNSFPGNKNTGNSLMNDIICQQFAKQLNLNVATSCYDFVSAYFNGEFWGSYVLREKISTEFIESHYQVNKDDVIVYKHNVVDDGDETLGNLFLEEMFSYLDNNDLSSDENYNYFINRYIDINSYYDWINLYAYCGCDDFIKYNNNNVMWRAQNISTNNEFSDGKLRFVLYDLDSSLSLLNDGIGTFNPKSKSFLDDKLYSNLFKNINFRQGLYNRAEEILLNNNAEKIICDTMHSIVPSFLESWDLNVERWAIPCSKAKVESYLENYAKTDSIFFKNRTADYLSIMQKYVLGSNSFQ